MTTKIVTTLRIVRSHLEISQSELAKLIKYNTSSIWERENGRKPYSCNSSGVLTLAIECILRRYGLISGDEELELVSDEEYKKRLAYNGVPHSKQPFLQSTIEKV